MSLTDALTKVNEDVLRKAMMLVENFMVFGAILSFL